MNAKTKMKARTFDELLRALPEEKRTCLEKLRAAIRAAAPRAEECISYGLPTFCLDGKPLVAIQATAHHCAFYPLSGTTIEAHKDELKDYDTSKGTIRFQADHPLPAALVRRLVQARIRENAAQQADPGRPVPARTSVRATRTPKRGPRT